MASHWAGVGCVEGGVWLVASYEQKDGWWLALGKVLCCLRLQTGRLCTNTVDE